MKQKGFIQIIVILIAVILIAAGVYYFGTKNKVTSNPVVSIQPSSGPVATLNTTAWKTYNDVKYFYSFNYPEDWEIQNNTISESLVLQSFTFQDLAFPYPTNTAQVVLEFKIFDNPNSLSPTDYITKNIYTSADYKKSIHEVSVGGNKMVRLDFGVDKMDIRYFIAFGKYIASFTFSSGEEKYDEVMNQTASQILSTFKFSSITAQQLKSPTVVFLPPLSNSDRKSERDIINTRVVNPYIDFQKDLDPSQQIVSITIEDNKEASSKNQYPYSFVATFKSIGANQILLGQTNGVLNWYEPTCMGCKLTAEFSQKYPEIAKQFDNVYYPK